MEKQTKKMTKPTCRFCNTHQISHFCGACQTAAYCSEKCQKQSWNLSHSITCLLIQGDSKKRLAPELSDEELEAKYLELLTKEGHKEELEELFRAMSPTYQQKHEASLPCHESHDIISFEDVDEMTPDNKTYFMVQGVKYCVSVDTIYSILNADDNARRVHKRNPLRGEFSPLELVKFQGEIERRKEAEFARVYDQAEPDERAWANLTGTYKIQAIDLDWDRINFQQMSPQYVVMAFHNVNDLNNVYWFFESFHNYANTNRAFWYWFLRKYDPNNRHEDDAENLVDYGIVRFIRRLDWHSLEFAFNNAVQKNDVRKIQIALRMMETDIDVVWHAITRKSRTDAFYNAAKKGNFEITTLFVKHFEKEPNTLENAFSDAAEYGHANIVAWFLQNVSNFNPNGPDEGNYPILFAAKNGHLNIVKMLMADKRVELGGAFDSAILNGHIEIVRLLMTDKRTHPEEAKNAAIRNAAAHGHLDIVKLLVADERVNAGDKDNNALHQAIEYGNPDVVRFLLLQPKVDPADLNNRAVRRSAERVFETSALYNRAKYGPHYIGHPGLEEIHGRHVEILKILLADKRVDPIFMPSDICNFSVPLLYKEAMESRPVEQTPMWPSD